MFLRSFNVNDLYYSSAVINTLNRCWASEVQNKSMHKSIIPVSIHALAPRAAVLKCGSFRFNSVCARGNVIQKFAVPRLQQSVPWSTAFQVASRHFCVGTDLTVFDPDTKLVVRNGQPFTGHGELRMGKSIHTGDFVDGKRHGSGVNKGDSGTTYEGEWSNGFTEGQGVVTNAEGNITSHGIFKKGKLFSGKGFRKTSHGSFYEGELLEGKRHGQGNLTYKSGKVWEGEFRHGEPFNGKGYFYRRQGVWVEGVFTADEKKKTAQNSESSVKDQKNDNAESV